jgi:hypothetical protein
LKLTITGATGLIGTRLVARLHERGDEVTVLSRDPERARATLGGVQAHGWRPLDEPAPAAALAGRDVVVHLAGENVAQRWTDEAKRKIRESREAGTRNLVAGLRAVADAERPGALVSSSAVGYYGKHGDELVDEDTPAGDDFLAEVCQVWEREADAARELGLRVVKVRTGVVLDKDGGALATMLPFFKAGVGGPVAGGGQWLPWIHAEDLVDLYLAAIDGDWSGPVNGTAPEPVTNKDFGRTLGKVLRRPAFAPVPAFGVRLLYGQMAEIVTEGQRAVPRRPLEHGFRFRHAELQPALADALGR